MKLNMLFNPARELQKLYNRGSLRNTERGFQFSIKNRLIDISLEGVHKICINQHEISLEQVWVQLPDGAKVALHQISSSTPIKFALAQVLTVEVDAPPLPEGTHRIELGVAVAHFGKHQIEVEDALELTQETVSHVAPRATILAPEPIVEEVFQPRTDVRAIPRNRGEDADDYTPEIIAERQQFVRDFTGKDPEHITHYSFDPHIAKGNIENFTGVIQIPLGFVGPIHIDGEHARGDFLVPLATTEGTLIASYNRGIKALNLSGGVRTTVVEDVMQRAPVFVFEDARVARNFVIWVQEHFDEIRQEAEATTRVGKLRYIDPYLASKYVYLRFNYATGDAAGQNMVGKATFFACKWIIDHYDGPEIKSFFLESNFATDKKSSQVNVLHTRGKRVTAEAVISREVLREVMRVEPEDLHYHCSVATTGAFLSGANNNGAHSPNAITAIFMATGQDVANVSESSAGILVTELLPDGNLYTSMTIPSLIVATYGGGTALATQRECLEIMGCYGKDKVRKLAEIIAGVVLAGELSLGSAISAGIMLAGNLLPVRESDWVTSHDEKGRNRK